MDNTITLEEIREALQKEAKEQDERLTFIISEMWRETDLGGLNFHVEENVGGEGKGDHRHVVLKVQRKNGTMLEGEPVYVMQTGYYDSYNGTEWEDDLHIVEPYMKEVRDWKKV